MKYEALLHRLKPFGITGIVYDSREAGPCKIFACIRGEHCDGHDYIDAALQRGTRVVLCDHIVEKDVYQIVVKDVRAFMGELAAAICNNPDEQLLMIGITGTNGKTTSAYITRSILQAAGIPCGLIGTVVYHDGLREEEADRTTPEGPDIQCLLERMVKNGCKACVMEASSHGLDQGRLLGCSFDRVGFTNLTQEHLEYHHSMEEYFSAKKLLFSQYTRKNWKGIINADDPYGHILRDSYPENSMVYSVLGSPNSDFSAVIREYTLAGMVVDVSMPTGEMISGLHVPLLGVYNVSNILQAIGIAWSLGVNNEAIRNGIERLSPVPGRLERYLLSNGVCCVIDFAHSPDGLEKVLSTLKEVCKGDLCILWGAGGDRTPLKRPVAGQIMAQWAQKIIITNDNPRTEDPKAIAEQIEQGILANAKSAQYRIILDRRKAIFTALSEAHPGDIVLIAGKGPEKYITIGKEKIPFQDLEVLLDWCRQNSVEIRS